MNYAIILAGGVGQRMRNSGMPKQFLEVHGKPIIIYTLQKFERCDDIDEVVIALQCLLDGSYERDFLVRYELRKQKRVIPGGKRPAGKR